MKTSLSALAGPVFVSILVMAFANGVSADDVCNSCGGAGRGMTSCPVCGGTGIEEYVMVHGVQGGYGCTNCGGVRGNPFRTDVATGRQGSGQVMGVCSACNGTGKPGPAQLRQEARNINEEGVRRYNNKDWAGAVACFQEANRKAPDDATIAKNLENAVYAKQRDDWEKEQRRKEALTASSMRDSLSDFSKQLEAIKPKTVEGLDFDGTQSPTGPGTPAPALDFARSPDTVFSDPMVVDLRDAVRKSVNMAVVSGAMPPASQAQDLQFINPLKPADVPSVPPPPRDPEQDDIMAVFNDPRLEDAFTDFLVAKVTGDKDGEKQANAKGAALAAEAVEKLTSKKHERLTKDQKMEILKQLSKEVETVHDRIRKQESADFETARLHYSQNVDAELAALRKQGILKPGDDIVDKVVHDPKVSKAVDEALNKCTQKLQAEYLEIDKKAMKDLSTEVTRIFKRPIEGVDDKPAVTGQQ